MSEQEWRDAILREITGPFSPSPNPESHDHGLWQAHRRLTDRLMAAVAPLRERERQQARQEVLTEDDYAAMILDLFGNSRTIPVLAIYPLLAESRRPNEVRVSQALLALLASERLHADEHWMIRPAAGGVS